MLHEDSPILVATDLQPGSDAALREAHARADATGVKLIVCHVMEAREELDAVRAAIDDRVRELTGREHGDFETVLAEGAPAELVCQAAVRRGAGLIVVGPGRAHLVVGDTTGKVIRNAHCAVLVARPAVESGVVLACTDFSDGSHPALVSGGTEARRMGGELIAVHVVPVDTMIESDAMGMTMAMTPVVTEELRRAAEDRLLHVLGQRRLDGRACALAGEAGAQILHVASALPAQLVVVGTHGRTGWRRFFVGSVAEQVAHGAGCSVLIERLSPPLAS
jgi:universal stress protein E